MPAIRSMCPVMKPESNIQPGGLDRRGFLQRGVAGALLGALGPLLTAGCTTPDAGVPDDLLFFTPKEYGIFSKTAEAMLPDDADVPSLLARLDLLMASADPLAQEDLHRALLALEYGPLALNLTFSRFSRLDLPARRRIVDAWSDSSLAIPRMVVSGLRQPLMFFYYSVPAVWKQIGYDGPLVDRSEVMPP